MQDTASRLKHELQLLLEEAGAMYDEWESKEEFENLTNLRSKYQKWYTKCLAVIEQLLPDRLIEFRNLYRLDKPPKQLDAGTYTISDYLEGLTQIYAVKHHHSVFLTKLSIQTSILGSAISRIDSILADAKGALRAELFDTELDGAKELAKNGYLRAAGMVGGVILETHLSAVSTKHQIKFTKSKPTLADYNEGLKKARIYDIPQWQKIQWLTSIRNICAHGGRREPTKDEIEQLLSGVEQVTKLIH